MIFKRIKYIVYKIQSGRKCNKGEIICLKPV